MDNSISFMENTQAHNKEWFLSKAYMNLLQIDGLCGSFYILTNVLHFVTVETTRGILKKEARLG